MNLQKRGKKGVYYIRFQWQGKDVWRSTGLTNFASAKAAAKAIENTIKMERIDALVKTKIRSPYPTLDKITALYRECAKVRRRTRNDNINSLANICRLVLGMELHTVKANALTSGLVRSYQHKKAALATNETQRASAEVSANSTLRQARSLFARKVMHLYDGFTLPDLSGFMRSPAMTEGKVHGFVPFPFAKWFGFCRVVWRLRDSDAEAWRLFLLMSRLGMSNREAYYAQQDWLERRGDANVMVIKVRNNFSPKSKKRIREIPVSGKVAAWLREQKDSEVFARRQAAARLNALFRKYFPDRQKGIYELRKHAGSIIATRDGVLTAAKFLGDRNETAEKFYIALLKPIKPI